MKRSLFLVLSILCACKDSPRGEMEPLPRPAGYQEPAPQPEVKRPPEPVDPSKVLLRWKLAVDSPLALQLEGTPEKGAASAPAPAKKKGKGAKTAPEPGPSSSTALNIVYVLQQPETGDLRLRVIPEGGTPDLGTVSERGFVLDGLDSTTRTLAALMMELPRDRVGPGDKWALGADLVDTAPLGPGFATKKSHLRNSVKLTALTPEGDEQVATLEYDLHESIDGVLTPPQGPSRVHPHGHGKSPLAKKKAEENHDHEHEEETPSGTARDVSTTVTVTGRGEFLVKAGRWRSWQGSLSAKTEGYSPKVPTSATSQVPEGKYALRLTPLDAVPAGLKLEALK
ncbi:hypothetical protein [Stigmatella erecta]|uniref:hypothetical protein n=1 Tax=Stigmatella erecta TaxID=83460 RepID=UPI000B8839C2|nr:hypothetical protein [Stigmatella erecta]